MKYRDFRTDEAVELLVSEGTCSTADEAMKYLTERTIKYNSGRNFVAGIAVASGVIAVINGAIVVFPILSKKIKSYRVKRKLKKVRD